MTPQALAAFATLVSFAQHGNRVDLHLDRGSAELTWISPGAFHFRRMLDGPLSPIAIPNGDAVPFKVEDTPSVLHIHSNLLDVALQKRGLLISVNGPDRTPLMVDLTEPKLEATRITWDRRSAVGERFYGLGRLDDPEMDLRGKAVDANAPLLVSSAGYGLQHLLGRFDFTLPGRYRIQTPQIDYIFFYGPKPKRIFEQTVSHKNIVPFSGFPQPAIWDGLRTELLEAVHQAMSGPDVLPFDFSDYETAPKQLQERIRQLASLTPELPATLDPSPFRKQLQSFFDIYAIETRDKHYPIWRALPFQFPDDPECAHHADEFMLGDEMLIAPIYTPGNKRDVYFPPGAWTSLDTDGQYPGRRTTAIETDGLPVFARNGAIVPLDSPDGAIGLHYFPSLGGEFFFLEKDLGQYSQVHAAPAGDILRLEIESRKDRVYWWVIHHVDRPTSVAFEDRQYPWSYDGQHRNLAVQVRLKAGEDNVIHVSW
jgi:hypothetical protein